MVSSSKSKLLNLKKWLTIPDAAQHLSIAFGEAVSEADVLRLALDGNLVLSVDFVNKARAKRGKIVRYTEEELKAALQAGNLPADLKWFTMPAESTAAIPNIPDDQKGKPLTYLASERIDEERYLTLEDEVVSIDGVWDLPMIGGEALDVEHEYQMMTGGPAVTLEVIDGTVVSRGENEYCVLQESFDDNEYEPGSKARLEIIKEKIAVENLDKSEAEKLLSKHKEDRKKYLARREKNKNNDYYPAGGLPRDAVYVVRIEELRKFEHRIGVHDESETPEQRKARLTARVNQEKAKGTKAFLKVVAEEEGFNVSRLKQIIYDYPKEKSSTTPANSWASLQVQKKPSSSKKPQTKY